MTIDLSIVSGTYNRRSYLERMIASVRRSIQPSVRINKFAGLTWEIVIVDGGSEDGSLEWLRRQSDVKLIEHGELLGGVKAFNDGAHASVGEYVVLANDDIEFIDDTLWRAWLFMQEHQDVGVGCFYQDRGGQDWHVENMPCVFQGQQASKPYGQVCIVPRLLGNRLGWWGNYLSTYGGDNELSANCYESGYKVVPIEGCKIHDNMPEDALRAINNIDGKLDPRAVAGGQHPDTYRWGKKWTQDRWLREGKKFSGPLVRDTPQFHVEMPAERERIIYLPIYEQGWDIQRQQKRGLRDALSKLGAVVEIDYVGEAASHRNAMLSTVRNAIERVKPTICLFQCHGPDPIGPREVSSFRQVTDAWFVNWNGDYWPQNLLSNEGMMLARAFDVQLTVNREVLDKYNQVGINADYWQIGWEPDGRGHEPRNDDERCDLVFLANGYSNERHQLVKSLQRMDLNFALWGQGWPVGWTRGQCLYDFKTACRLYRGAKFSLGDSQWPDSGFVSNRVMQALVAGNSVLCHQWFRGMDELGLVDGETCIIWRTVDELRQKLEWYRGNEQERQRVAQAGERLALERHSFDVRVKELLGMKPGSGWEDWR